QGGRAAARAFPHALPGVDAAWAGNVAAPVAANPVVASVGVRGVGRFAAAVRGPLAEVARWAFARRSAMDTCPRGRAARLHAARVVPTESTTLTVVDAILARCAFGTRNALDSR